MCITAGSPDPVVYDLTIQECQNCNCSNMKGKGASALLKENAGFKGNLLILAEQVLRRRPVLLAPPAADQHPQLVVPAHMLLLSITTPSISGDFAL